MATQNITQIPAPRVPLVDVQTNTVSREWFMWFNNLYAIVGAGTGITPVINGGTGLGTIPTNGQLLIGNGTGYTLNTLTAGTGISVTNSSGAISIANTGVTLVNTTGTVNGITLTGGPITASGTVTLGGTLNLSSPPAIGGTTPAAGTFTTLIGGGGSANYGQLTGGATTKAVEFKTLGTDTNVAFAIRTQGTGAIDLAAGSRGVNISNGGTVTAITRTASGGPSYTTIPTITISPPTTDGGVQATATTPMFLSSATVSAGGSGYAVGNVLTAVGGTGSAAILTVATLSGSAVATVTITNAGAYTVLPTNPVSVTGGAGAGATFTFGYGVGTPTIVLAGSGYVEQPTVTFSSGTAAAYASVGGTAIVRALGQNLDFYTPNNTSTPSLRVLDNQNAGTGQFISVRSSSTTPLLLSSAALNISSTSTNSVSIFTNANSQEQLRVSHTTSAVDYVQITGGTTALKIVTISAQGSDTDVDLALTPKGTGRVRFGTYTAVVTAVAGYIEVKDSGGTLRKLAVLT